MLAETAKPATLADDDEKDREEGKDSRLLATPS